MEIIFEDKINELFDKLDNKNLLNKAKEIYKNIINAADCNELKQILSRNASISDVFDNSIFIEFIFKEKRIGILIDEDEKESGWHFISKNLNKENIIYFGGIDSFCPIKLLDLLRL